MQGKYERLGSGLLNRSLRTDESGLALIHLAVLLPVIIGFVLIAVDGGWYRDFNSALRHAALAQGQREADELAGATSAVARHENAAETLITNSEALASLMGVASGWKSAADATRRSSDSTPSDLETDLGWFILPDASRDGSPAHAGAAIARQAHHCFSGLMHVSAFLPILRIPVRGSVATVLGEDLTIAEDLRMIS